MVARAQQPKYGIDRRHPGRKNVGALPAFKFSHRALQRFAVGVIGPRVVIPFIFSELCLHVCRGLINRRDNRARGRFGFLAYMYRIGRKTHILTLLTLAIPKTILDAMPARRSALANKHAQFAYYREWIAAVTVS